jgi:hypothetical protein
MKTFLILVIVFFIMFINMMSCQKAKVNTGSGSGFTTYANTVDGQWSLVHIYGGLTGLNELHEKGDVTWSIDSVNNVITITNLTNVSNNNTRFDSGTYSFQMNNQGGEIHLTVNNEDMGTYVINGNEMLLDQNVAADGLYYRFVR